MKISDELRIEWDKNYEHGDFARIAKHGSLNGKTFTAENITRAFRRGSASTEVINIINDYFQYKRKFHKSLVRQIQTA